MIILHWARFILAALLMGAGLLTLLATAVGLFRFHYVLNRINVAAKCDTFGVLLTFSSLILILGWDIASLKLFLIMVFLWLANPVSGHLMAHLEVATNPDIMKECEIIRYDAD
ncbi:MAG: monovalent cation/H(+) antiporter subunit G [Treponema sp.]|nr:monovalent cation/H(+) antiporter subunit G [Treponema sp.]